MHNIKINIYISTQIGGELFQQEEKMKESFGKGEECVFGTRNRKNRKTNTYQVAMRT